MAVALVSVTDNTMTTGQATNTLSVVVSAGSNRLLVVVSQEAGSIGASGVSGITFNGSEAFTQRKSFASTLGGTFCSQRIWTLTAPTQTTANVVVSYQTGSTDDRAQAFSVYYFTGVDQTTPLDAVSTNGTGTGTTASCSVTTVAANAWVIDNVIGNNAVTVGAGQTSRVNRLIYGTTLYGASSTVDGKASPGAETMDWTLLSADWSVVAISIAPATASSTYSHPLSGKFNNLLIGRLG
jgi:hypothetical protein